LIPDVLKKCSALAFVIIIVYQQSLLHKTVTVYPFVVLFVWVCCIVPHICLNLHNLFVNLHGLNKRHLLLLYTDVSLLGKNINTTKEKHRILLVTGKEVGDFV
jgi:hypothetical protein